MSPIRLQRKRTPGYSLKEESLKANGLEVVCVTRPGKWGNPFQISNSAQPYREYAGLPYLFCHNRKQVIENYKWFLEYTEEGRKIVEMAKKELKGKNIACFCKLTDDCHGDFLLEVANA